MGMNDEKGKPEGPDTPATGAHPAPPGADARFKQGGAEWKRAVGSFLGVCGLVILLSSSTLGMYSFGAESWLTLGPIGFSLVCLATWLALTYSTLTQRLSQRAAQFLGLTAGYTAALVAILGGGTYLLALDPITFDFSAAGVHSLSEQSIKVLQQLDTPVRVTAFLEKGDPASGVFEAYADRFERESKLLEFRMFSPTYDIEEVQAYKVTAESPPIIVETHWDDPTKKKEARFGIDMRDLHQEEAFTNAIMSASLLKRKRIYLTTGHGEADPNDAAPEGFKATADDLRNEGYDVLPLNLVDVPQVPEDTAVLLVAGPTQRFLTPEKAAITTYLAAGGRAAIFLEQGGFEHGLDDLLGTYGVQANKDIVLDVSDYGRRYGATQAIATSYAQHPITEKFMRTTTLFPDARSLSVNPVPGVQTVPLVKSTDRSWGETDFESITRGDAGWDAGEARGPVTLAVAVERSLAEDPEDPAQVEAAPRVRMVVVGDASFATNQHRRLGANRNLVLNIMGWLADDEDRIAIRPKSRGANLIVLTPNQRDGIAFFVLYVLPVSLLSLGLGIWLVRRQR